MRAVPKLPGVGHYSGTQLRIQPLIYLKRFLEFEDLPRRASHSGKQRFAESIHMLFIVVHRETNILIALRTLLFFSSNTLIARSLRGIYIVLLRNE